jgi:osmotically-inducible protein OsmY
MTTTTRNQHDHLIQADVKDELAWAPEVNDAHVGIAVLDGVVTLSGQVDSFNEVLAAKKSALRVSGVSVVANDLTVHNPNHFAHTDTQIAAAIKHVLDWTAELPEGSIQVEVRNHVVVLTGAVKWNYQRTNVEKQVRGLAGVQRIDNQIALTARVSATDASKLIKSALVRHALHDAKAISVTASGSEITLTGQVSTWAEKNDAAHAAWSSPHTSAVHNKITVHP